MFARTRFSLPLADVQHARTSSPGRTLVRSSPPLLAAVRLWRAMHFPRLCAVHLSKSCAVYLTKFVLKLCAVHLSKSYAVQGPSKRQASKPQAASAMLACA